MSVESTIEKIKAEKEKKNSYFSLPEVAEIVGKSYASLSKEIVNVDFTTPPVRDGNHLLFTQQNVDQICIHYENRPKKTYTKKTTSKFDDTNLVTAVMNLKEIQEMNQAILSRISASLTAIALNLHCLTLAQETQVSEPARKEYIEKLNKLSQSSTS